MIRRHASGDDWTGERIGIRISADERPGGRAPAGSARSLARDDLAREESTVVEPVPCAVFESVSFELAVDRLAGGVEAAIEEVGDEPIGAWFEFVGVGPSVITKRSSPAAVVLRGASEPHDADGDAPVHPADQRLLEADRQARRHDRPLVLLPDWVCIHGTLRVTPAMAAGLTDSLRGMEWIVGLIDARAPKPRTPKKYMNESTRVPRTLVPTELIYSEEPCVPHFGPRHPTPRGSASGRWNRPSVTAAAVEERAVSAGWPLARTFRAWSSSDSSGPRGRVQERRRPSDTEAG